MRSSSHSWKAKTWLREQLATALQSAAAAKTTIASEREKAQVADALRESAD